VSRDKTEGTEEVSVTPDMEKAGLQEFYEVGLDDPAYLVRSIYMAMQYEWLVSQRKR
jgi:hypothetical protein